MINVNNVFLIGNLAENPVFGQSGGREYMRVRVITNKSWRDESGEWKSRSEGHTVSTWDKFRIAHGREKLRKGVPVYVSGELRTTSKVEDGKTTYYTGIFVGIEGKLHSLETRQRSDEPGETPPNDMSEPRDFAANHAAESDEIPF